jgi:hypothetical protein
MRPVRVPRRLVTAGGVELVAVGDGDARRIRRGF